MWVIFAPEKKTAAPMIKVEKPRDDEFNCDALPYIHLLPADGEIIKHLINNFKRTKNFILSIPRKKLEYRYAPDKWTIKEMLVHVMDEERVYTYRALRIARNDKTPLPGYNADRYALYAIGNERKLKDIFNEFDTIRKATVSLFKSFDEAAFLRTGIVNENKISVRAMAYHIAGHELHHTHIIKERYL